MNWKFKISLDGYVLFGSVMKWHYIDQFHLWWDQQLDPIYNRILWEEGPSFTDFYHWCYCRVFSFCSCTGFGPLNGLKYLCLYFVVSHVCLHPSIYGQLSHFSFHFGLLMMPYAQSWWVILLFHKVLLHPNHYILSLTFTRCTVVVDPSTFSFLFHVLCMFLCSTACSRSVPDTGWHIRRQRRYR